VLPNDTVLVTGWGLDNATVQLCWMSLGVGCTMLTPLQASPWSLKVTIPTGTRPDVYTLTVCDAGGSGLCAPDVTLNWPNAQVGEGVQPPLLDVPGG